MLTLGLLFVLTSAAKAHKEPTHQYICREAYELLRKHVGSVPVMSDFMGTTEGRDCVPDEVLGIPDGVLGLQCWQVVAGVWDEDQQDIIFHQYGPLGILVSATHFWWAGLDENHPVHLAKMGFAPIRWTPPEGLPNALQKFRTYLNGGWTAYFMRGDYIYEFTYPGLIEFYRNGTVTYNKRYDVDDIGMNMRVITNEFVVPNNQRATTFETMIGVSDPSERRGRAFNILGRMAHLLQDMSVPAHTHNTQHGCPRDLYEDVMNVEAPEFAQFATYWDDSRTFAEKGGMTDYWENCGDDVGLFFMRNLGVIASHYADFQRNGREFTSTGDALRHRYGQAGITTYASYDDSYDFLNEYCTGFTAAIPPIFCECHSGASYRVEDTRNYTLSYAIRATAGLFYWFAKEAGLLDQCGNNWIRIQNVSLNNNHRFEGLRVLAGRAVDLGAPSGDVVVTSTARSKVTLRAQEEVVLMDGFTAVVNQTQQPTDYAGANVDAFHAYIGPCSTDVCEVPSSLSIMSVEDVPGGSSTSLRPTVAPGLSAFDNGRPSAIVVSVGKVQKTFGGSRQLPFGVSPNPSFGTFRLVVEQEVKGEYQWQILNERGDIVVASTVAWHLDGEMRSLEVDATALASGAYWVRLIQHDVTLGTAKVTVVR